MRAYWAALIGLGALCLFFGGYSARSHASEAAGSWSAAYMPQPPESGNGHRASGVSCIGSDECVAVGENWSLEVHTRVTLAELWDGSSWTPMETPNPPGLDEGWKHEWHALLRGVSCAAADACVAVGRYRSSEDEAVRPLAERWDGSEWTTMALPLPGGAAAAQLEAVSCPSATECNAVGNSRSALGVDETLALHWDGAQWTIQSTPNPVGAVGSKLLGVSCSSIEACVAVGASEAAGGSESTLAERWDGSEWKAQIAPNPGSSSVARFDDVSCPSSTTCAAVGYFKSGPTLVTLAERWDGSKWAVQETPTPEGEGNLYGVSCASSTACTAVGTYYVKPEPDHGWQSLIERWSGGSWSVLGVAGLPVPEGWWHESPLNAVSCPQAEACTAVGEALGASPEALSAYRAFAEHEGDEGVSPVEGSQQGSVLPTPPSAGFRISQVRRACQGRIVFSLDADAAGSFVAAVSARSAGPAGGERRPGRSSSCNAAQLSARKGRFHWGRPFNYGKGSARASEAGLVQLTVTPTRAALRAIRRRSSLRLKVTVTFQSKLGGLIAQRKLFLSRFR